MDNLLRVGIVGASGWMAGALGAGAEYSGKVDKNSDNFPPKSEVSCIAGLCDLDIELLKERQKELGFDRAKLFTDYDAMLACPDIDAVIVAVPNSMHARFAINAIRAGKHVFLEKPFATTAADSKELMQVAANSCVTTKLDYILVHYDEQQKLREMIRREAFGPLASTHFTYRHPIQVSESPGQRWKLLQSKSGGAIPMGICHAISLTVFQVDANPIQVICKSQPPRVRAFDYDPQMDIMVTFDNGVVSLIQGNIDFAEKYDARHTVIGVNGQFDYNPFNPRESRVMWSSQSEGREYSADADFASDHLDSGDVWEHKCVDTIRAFIANARAGRKDPVLGLESSLIRRCEAIIWAAEESAVANGTAVDCSKFLG